jgi:hypothetical protein
MNWEKRKEDDKGLHAWKNRAEELFYFKQKGGRMVLMK